MNASKERKTMIVRVDLWRRIAILSAQVSEKRGGQRQIGLLTDEVLEAGLPLVERRYQAREKKVAVG